MKKAVIALSILVIVLAGALVMTLTSNEEITITAEDLNQAEIKIDQYVNPGHMISADAARTLMTVCENVVVLDIRKAADYALGHIPGAQNIFRGDYSAGEDVYGFGGMRADRATMEALLSRLGVHDDSQILAYDASGDYDAARFWWQLEMHGFDNVRLIDGGIVAWEAAGFEISTEVPAVTPTEFTFSRPEDAFRLATLEDVIAAIDDPDTILLDTRAITEFTGEETKRGAFRPGRIPGAIWLEWSDSLGEHRTFSDIATLRAQFEELGITPDKTIIAYCQSGVRSAHTTFVLTQLMGYPNVLNYDGSWIEWSYNEDLVAETGMPEDVAVRISSR